MIGAIDTSNRKLGKANSKNFSESGSPQHFRHPPQPGLHFPVDVRIGLVEQINHPCGCCELRKREISCGDNKKYTAFQSWFKTKENMKTRKVVATTREESGKYVRK